jgi:hypothetical protein
MKWGAGWDYANKATIVGTILSFAFGIMWYVKSVESRIETLQAQMQAVVTAPRSEAKSAGGSATSRGPIENPIQKACAELAARAASEYGLKTIYANDAARAIEAMMARLGCVKLN